MQKDFEIWWAEQAAFTQVCSLHTSQKNLYGRHSLHFFLIIIRLSAEKVSLQARRMDFQHLKSLVTSVIVFYLGVIIEEKLAFTNCKILGGKGANELTHSLYNFEFLNSRRTKSIHYIGQLIVLYPFNL